MRLPPLYAEYRMLARHEMQYALAAVAQAHARPPPRPTQLPAPQRCHMPHVSAHAVSPHASTASHVSASHAHTRKPHTATTRTAPHRAPHSYPRHDAATCRTYRRTPYRHAPRSRDHVSASHAHTRRPHAATTRTAPHRAPHSYPAIRRCHMPRVSAHAVSPHAAVARRGRLGLLCAPRTAVAPHGLVALRIWHAPRAQIQRATPSRRRACHHKPWPRCRSRGRRAGAQPTSRSRHLSHAMPSPPLQCHTSILPPTRTPSLASPAASRVAPPLA